MAAAAAESKCKVARLTCEHDAETLGKFFDIIKAQLAGSPENYKDEFPWEKECYNSGYVHYIAHGVRADGSPIVCGWMVVLPHNDALGKRVYLIGISTRRTRDMFYGGVGQLLHNTLVNDYTREGYDFIHLWPLNDTVRAIYSSAAWGYVSLREDIGHMFRILKAPPSEEFLDSLITKETNPIDELDEFMENYVESNSGIGNLYSGARPHFAVNSKNFKNLSMNLQVAATFETEDDITIGMMEALTRFLEKHASKKNTKTRKSKGKKGTKRKSRR
jgi:hypothetical protein